LTERYWGSGRFPNMGLRASKPWNPGPTLASAAPDRPRIEIARPRRQRSVTAGFSGEPRRPHRPFSDGRASAGGLQAEHGFSTGRFHSVARRWKTGACGVGGPAGTRFEPRRTPGFGTRPPAGSIRGSPRPVAYHSTWLGTLRGP
jgi:hypothetical protein